MYLFKMLNIGAHNIYLKLKPAICSCVRVRNFSWMTEKECLKTCVIFVFTAFRFYWLVNLNSTVVFLGIAYIQQSVAKNLAFLIPFTSALLALIAIHMMRNKLTYKPKKGKKHTQSIF